MNEEKIKNRLAPFGEVSSIAEKDDKLTIVMGKGWVNTSKNQMAFIKAIPGEVKSRYPIVDNAESKADYLKLVLKPGDGEKKD